MLDYEMAFSSEPPFPAPTLRSIKGKCVHAGVWDKILTSDGFRWVAQARCHVQTWDVEPGRHTDERPDCKDCLTHGPAQDIMPLADLRRKLDLWQYAENLLGSASIEICFMYVDAIFDDVLLAALIDQLKLDIKNAYTHSFEPENDFEARFCIRDNADQLISIVATRARRDAA